MLNIYRSNQFCVTKKAVVDDRQIVPSVRFPASFCQLSNYDKSIYTLQQVAIVIVINRTTRLVIHHVQQQMYGLQKKVILSNNI